MHQPHTYTSLALFADRESVVVETVSSPGPFTVFGCGPVEALGLLSRWSASLFDVQPGQAGVMMA